MINFSGTYNATIDDKGRVMLPSVLKKELGGFELDSLVVEKNHYKNCLDVYHEEVWEKRVESFEDTLEEFDEEDVSGRNGFCPGLRPVHQPDG